MRGQSASARTTGAGSTTGEQTALLARDPDDDPVPAAPGLVGVQTPQAFRAQPLLDAYRRADRDGFTGTDTAACVAQYTDLAIHGVPGPATNLKITFAEDVALAARLVAPE